MNERNDRALANSLANTAILCDKWGEEELTNEFESRVTAHLAPERATSDLRAARIKALGEAYDIAAAERDALRAENERLTMERKVVITAAELAGKAADAFMADAVRLTAEKERLTRIEKAAIAIQDSIGWRGTLGINPDIYYCECCQASHADWRLIEHTLSCPVRVLRAALTPADATGGVE